MAVSKMHGVWVDDKRLDVKEACFGQRKELLKPKVPRFSENRVLEPRQRINTITKRGNEEHTINGGGGPVWNGKFRGGSFAQVLRGEPSIPGPSKESVISVKSDGAGGGWLLRSAVAIMNRVVSLKFLKGSFNKALGKDVQFRAMGGRHVLITFPNSEVRDVLIKDPWMAQWFTLVKPWQGEPASTERFVWLSCYGMPLNA